MFFSGSIFISIHVIQLAVTLPPTGQPAPVVFGCSGGAGRRVRAQGHLGATCDGNRSIKY